MLTTYTTDGSTTRFTFNWPYLERSHIMVTRDTAPALFKFISDQEVEVKTLFGEPLPAGEVLKIFRVTPDLVSFAEFRDASNLSALDLNRARLQVLFLIQERSGGMAGSVSQVVQLLTNEIETLSGALDTLQYSQGLLQSGLQTIDDLGARITAAENEGDALAQAINDAVTNFDATLGAISTRMDAVEVQQGNLQASVSSQLATLVSNDLIQASRVDTLEARVDTITSGEDNGEADESAEVLAASLIQTAIAQVKNGVALAQRIESLEAQVGDDIQALIQQEQTARADADTALAAQITTLQAAIDGDLAQVVEDMSATVDRVGGLEAQWTLKAQVQRADGKTIMAGIGLAATANDDMSGSEIVMMADRLVFADPAAPEGTLKPMFVAGNVDGSPTFIVPANVLGDRVYPGRVLVDGSVEARSIKANEITGDKLKAGTITTREIDVSLGVNILQNTEFVDSDGFIPTAWSIAGTTWNGAWGISHGMDMGGWTLAGSHTYWARQTVTNGDANIDSAYAAVNSGWRPVTPGSRYEFSVYSGAHRCKVVAQIVFANAAGTWLATSTMDADATNNREALGGTTLGTYKRIGGFATAPAGTTQAMLWIRKGLHNVGEADSYVFLTRPMIAEALPNQTRLSPYTISGLGTKITPGGITTPSLSALSANIGLLRTATSGARTEIESNQIRVYDSSGVMRVRMGLW